jgi:hypothetical protein
MKPKAWIFFLLSGAICVISSYGLANEYEFKYPPILPSTNLWIISIFIGLALAGAGFQITTHEKSRFPIYILIIYSIAIVVSFLLVYFKIADWPLATMIYTSCFLIFFLGLLGTIKCYYPRLS